MVFVLEKFLIKTFRLGHASRGKRKLVGVKQCGSVHSNTSHHALQMTAAAALKIALDWERRLTPFSYALQDGSWLWMTTRIRHRLCHLRFDLLRTHLRVYD